MKKETFESDNPKISLEDIIIVEQEFGIQLPENLKKLLLVYNGGTIELEETGGAVDEYALSCFFSIKYGYEANTIECNINCFQIVEEHIPKEEIPFADDQGGNILTISTRVEDYGTIYY